MVFDLCTSYLFKVVKISQRVSELLNGHDFHTKIFKGS